MVASINGFIIDAAKHLEIVRAPVGTSLRGALG